MTESQLGDLIAQLGRLTGRFETSLSHLATKEDVAELRVRLDDHLSSASEDRALSTRIKLIAISALIAAVPASIAAIASLL